VPEDGVRGFEHGAEVVGEGAGPVEEKVTEQVGL
jgi:hypothetical protein